MADITASLVKELRERTGAGIAECKKVLVETLGDIEMAIDNMRRSGQAKAVKKAGRITAEGAILTKISHDSKYGVIIEINCETDFVAKNSRFRNFSKEVITAALEERVADIEILKSKFEEKRTMLVAKIGENVNIRRFGILEGDMISSYLHNNMRIGVIVSASSANKELVKHVAMHIAASKPEYVNTDDVPSYVLAREHQIQMDVAMKSGKTREIAEKMVEGRMRKFTGEISLTGQKFVMNPSKTVGQLLNEHGAKINNFIRFEVGEDIQKAEVYLADEVTSIGKSFN